MTGDGDSPSEYHRTCASGHPPPGPQGGEGQQEISVALVAAAVVLAAHRSSAACRSPAHAHTAKFMMMDEVLEGGSFGCEAVLMKEVF